MKKDNRKLFIVKKYIMATSASDAIRKDKKTPPDSVWVDDKWAETNQQLASAIGFTIGDDQD